MELSSKIASDITIFSKYAKYKKELKRRESWEDICDRKQDCLVKQYPELELKIVNAMKFERKLKVLGSMRMAQFAGVPVERNHSRVYNCAFHSAKDIEFFSNTMFLLLGGSGVGYSVQDRHVSQLPELQAPLMRNGKVSVRKFLVSDTIEGWSDAIKVLMNYYLKGAYKPKFDFSDIREKGMPLITAGGKAPGPEPLRTALSKMAGILDNKEIGTRLSSSEVSDLCCYIADAVYSGGIRRAAMICLFDMTDEAMLGYKTGAYWDTNPHRARVNVSAVALREDIEIDLYEPGFPAVALLTTKKTTKEQFQSFWKFVQDSGTGEPGIYFTNDLDSGTNPCCEIALKDKQFCNLTTINFSTVTSQADLIARAKTAAFLGTLQAGFTDFHYLGDEWASNCEEEALLGVSVTGIADGNNYRKFDWKAVAEAVVKRNVETAKLIGINSAARTTCIKPEGTTSLVCGTSSGIHGRHAHYYIRRIEFDGAEAISVYLKKNHPELVVDYTLKPGWIKIELPQKSPDRSIYRNENVMDCLERVKFFSEEWVKNGHVSGQNTHNVSCTISVKPDEWKKVGAWMWTNRNYYNGIAVMPYDGGHYIQPPFEDCTKEKYETMMKTLKKVDLSKIIETEDNTEIGDTIACQGGSCEI